MVHPSDFLEGIGRMFLYIELSFRKIGHKIRKISGALFPVYLYLSDNAKL